MDMIPHKETQMPAIQVASSLYEQTRIRAAEAGFASVDEYVAEILRDNVVPVQNFDHLFTPERIAKLDQIVANIESTGHLLSEAEVDAHFKSRREAWQSK